MKKWIAVFMACMMMVSVLAGCGGDQSEQYGPYVQSLLDVSYKKDASVYLELVDDTQENVDGYYEDTMLYWAYEVADAFYMVLINEEVEARMVTLMENVFSHAKYEVADAVKAGDYYTVEVTIHPINFTDLVYDEVAVYAEDFQLRSEAGEYGDYENDDAAYEAWEVAYANGVLDILESYLDQLDYAEPVSKIVKVTVDEDDLYGISEEDQYDLESYLIY